MRARIRGISRSDTTLRDATLTPLTGGNTPRRISTDKSREGVLGEKPGEKREEGRRTVDCVTTFSSPLLREIYSRAVFRSFVRSLAPSRRCVSTVRVHVSRLFDVVRGGPWSKTRVVSTGFAPRVTGDSGNQRWKVIGPARFTSSSAERECSRSPSLVSHR